MAANGIIIGFGGVILLIGFTTNHETPINGYGAVALVLASLFWAMGSLYGRYAALPPSPLLGTGMEMLSGGAVLLILACLLGEWSGFDHAAVSLRSALALVYLTIIGAGAFVAYVWLLRVAPTPLVESIGGGFTRLLLGPGADNASNFVRGDTDSWLGDLGERAWASR